MFVLYHNDFNGIQGSSDCTWLGIREKNAVFILNFRDFGIKRNFLHVPGQCVVTKSMTLYQVIYVHKPYTQHVINMSIVLNCVGLKEMNSGKNVICLNLWYIERCQVYFRTNNNAGGRTC